MFAEVQLAKVGLNNENILLWKSRNGWDLMIRRNLLGTLIVLAAFFSLSTAASAQDVCGDVDGNGCLDLQDLVELLDYLYTAGAEPPANIEKGDVDPFPGLDMADVTYMSAFFFDGAGFPCDGESQGENLPGGETSLDHVDGLIDSCQIIYDYYTKFHIRFSNETEEIFRATSNGFRVFSPDGATVEIHDFYVSDCLTDHVFIWSMLPDVFDPNGFGWYGWYLDAGPGINPGTSDIAFVITLAPFSSDNIDKTVCIDSAFYGNGGAWIWQVSELSYHVPSWDGPHCFSISEFAENPPVEVEIIPETVQVTTSQWLQDPSSAAFYVTDSAGNYFRFTAAESCTWFDVDKLHAVAPEWVYLDIDTSGLGYGTYVDSAIVDADNGLNAPRTVYVHFDHEDPDSCWYEVFEGDSLIFPSVTVNPCNGVQPVAVKLVNRVAGATIPIAAPPEVTIKDISFEGLVTEEWNLNIFDIRPDSNYVLVGLINTEGYYLDLGSTTVFNIIFDYNQATCSQGDRASYIHWDTTLSDDPSRSLQFATNCTALGTNPQFDPGRDMTTIRDVMPGDFQADGDLNITDLTDFVKYLFCGGANPFLLNSMDVNRDCQGPDIGDLTYVVDYLFLGGNAPECGCLGEAPKVTIVSEKITIATIYDGERTFIRLNSPMGLRGVHLELRGNEHAEFTNLYSKSFELVHGNNNEIMNVGYLDLDGGEIIAPGDQNLFAVTGVYTIKSATVSDAQHDSYRIDASAKSGMLPDEFALYQNYPNPFNPETTLKFSLREAADYELCIFNATGQKVAGFTGRGGAGMNEIRWDASEFASGVYLYRLRAGGCTDARKMILLR